MQLVGEFRSLSKRAEMETTCLENKYLSKFIDYDNQDSFILTHFFPTFLFDSPKRIRKSKVF